VRREVAVASWSPKQSGLIAREDFGEAPRSNFEKINSKDYVRRVPAVVRGWSTAMDVMSGMPIRRGRSRRGFNATFVGRLPYRAVRAERLQGDFDQRAGIQTQGLDPPPRVAEAGCLQRAWSALTARVKTLQEAFGQLVSSTVSDGASFWANVRQSFNSVAKMLCFLSEHHRISLLGNYRCLRAPA
jgi:hypothetical protein